MHQITQFAFLRGTLESYLINPTSRHSLEPLEELVIVEVNTLSFCIFADVIVIQNLLYKNVSHQQDAHELLTDLPTAMQEADIKTLRSKKIPSSKIFLKVHNNSK